jgi:CelD/BcsL family acetyltransferase involved in cellulose biosynthesis
VGCALLAISGDWIGPFPVRRAYINASGGGGGCEHNDVLTQPEHRAAVLNDLVRLIVSEKIDELALIGVREQFFRELWARWPVLAHEGHLSESPYVNLERLRVSGETYLSRLSASTRSQIRRSIRLYQARLEAVEVRAANTAEEAMEWFGALLTLHVARWRERDGTSVFADADIRCFHRRLLMTSATAAAPGGFKPEILRIRFGTEVIAYLYHLRYRGRVNFVQSGLAYHRDNRLKPGLVAHGLAIEHYLALGSTEYDFLGGEAEAVRYKRSLATERRMLAWVELPSANSKMRVIRSLRLARRRARLLWHQP